MTAVNPFFLVGRGFLILLRPPRASKSSSMILAHEAFGFFAALRSHWMAAALTMSLTLGSCSPPALIAVVHLFLVFLSGPFQTKLYRASQQIAENDHPMNMMKFHKNYKEYRNLVYIIRQGIETAFRKAIA